MSRMLDLIRASALPSHQMMTAARGALQVPAAEMVEILVYLAEHNKIFGESARLTLAGWEEASSQAIASDPKTPKEVLDYWLSPKNIRPALFPILLENQSVPVGKLSELATTLKGEWIDTMLASPRVRSSPQLLTAVRSNKELSGVQSARVQELIRGEPVGVYVSTPATPEVALRQPVLPEANSEIHATVLEPGAEISSDVPSEPSDPETEDALVAFFTEHASEIAAEGDKPFHPIGGMHEEETHAEPEVKAAAAVASASPSRVPPIKPAFPKKLVNPADEHRGSVLQKIARLDIKGRIQLAMKGSKEERLILVRDGTKIVAIAVLDSPKISDGEVEKIASQRNVLEAVLRAIPLKRRFIKNYAVMRNLVFNPRTPMDISLGLMKNLLVQDLRNLSGNKEVGDTIRKLALRMFKQKTENANKK
jgi:hypothetical protein